VQIEIDDSELADIDQVGTEIISQAMLLTLIDYHSRIREEAPIMDGQLRGSFTYEQLDPVTGRIRSDLRHALFVMHGTGPIPNLPWAPIEEWAQKKGLPTFPVWHKIRTEGVSANPYHERAWQTTRQSLQEFMSTALQRAGGA